MVMGVEGNGWRGGMKINEILEMLKEPLWQRRWSPGTLAGTTPPATFVGESGYPRVSVGSALPQHERQLSIYEDPRSWLDMTIDEIVALRTYAVLPVKRAKVAPIGDRDIELFQQMTMGDSPVDTELKVGKIVRRSPVFNGYYAPVGTSIEALKVLYMANPKVPRPIEKVAGDRDMKASDGALALYNSDISIYKIQNLLSIGLIGRKRRLVPTKWGITATDSMIGDALLDLIRDFPRIDRYLVSHGYFLGNRFVVILTPDNWQFEMLESWLPFFGRQNTDTTIAADHEGYFGRSAYASNIEGAYYAARLAILEYLRRIRKQAGGIVLMEVDRNWTTSLGVWRVREGIRRALQQFTTYDELDSAKNAALCLMSTKKDNWIRSSLFLTKRQLDITQFLS
ncbi:MAG: hypothetical protein JRN19_05250 [Nitrososphaerota archaeon]|nr:hypothetical protein [Nitrososphaerota archaeon]MDG7051840.1 hypothetical protein [Nitrososphaerota archaeon]